MVTEFKLGMTLNAKSTCFSRKTIRFCIYYRVANFQVRNFKKKLSIKNLTPAKFIDSCIYKFITNYMYKNSILPYHTELSNP